MPPLHPSRAKSLLNPSASTDAIQLKGQLGYHFGLDTTTALPIHEEGKLPLDSVDGSSILLKPLQNVQGQRGVARDLDQLQMALALMLLNLLVVARVRLATTSTRVAVLQQNRMVHE